MNQEKIGKFIKKIREENHLTQKDFALKYNVSFQAVSKWENGRNMPDIALLKQICEDYGISMDELLDAKVERKNSKKNYFLVILLVIILIIAIGFFLKKDNHFEFKEISTTCSTFKITGSTAYNKNKSSIYISSIEFCGEKENSIYKKIDYALYENHNNVNVKISSGNEKFNITLEDYLSNLKIHVDDYKKMCKTFSESELYIEINATDGNEKMITYKIPITLEDNCE